MIYIFYGEDSLSIRETVASMKQAIEPAEMRDFNVVTFRGQELNFDQLAAACATVPFLALKRLVVVEGLLGQFEPKGPSRGRESGEAPPTRSLGQWEALPPLLPALPESTDLVFTDGGLSAQNPLFARLKPLAKVTAFPLPTGAGLRQWVNDRASKKGIAIDQAAIGLLTEVVGNNLEAMDNELEKLALYRKGQPVRREDVEEMVSYVREANIFATVDAVLEGRAGMALKLVHQLLEAGRPSAYVLTMLARQVRLLLLAKELRAQRLPVGEIGKRLGLSRYPLEKTLEQESRFTQERLLEIYPMLLEADLSIKTGVADEDTVLDVLIAELASGTVQPRAARPAPGRR